MLHCNEKSCRRIATSGHSYEICRDTMLSGRKWPGLYNYKPLFLISNNDCDGIHNDRTYLASFFHGQCGFNSSGFFELLHNIHSTAQHSICQQPITRCHWEMCLSPNLRSLSCSTAQPYTAYIMRNSHWLVGQHIQLTEFHQLQCFSLRVRVEQ